MKSREALLELAKGKSVKRKSWSNEYRLYVDLFGFIRMSNDGERVDWNQYAHDTVEWEVMGKGIDEDIYRDFMGGMSAVELASRHAKAQGEIEEILREQCWKNNEGC